MVLAAGRLAVGCAQGSDMKTALPVLSLSRNLSVSPPTISLAAASASLAAGRGHIPPVWVMRPGTARLSMKT
jgi:hypothetical protein